jgi:proteasome activator subunit 4
MNDNPELQATSGRLLAMITSITPSLRLVEPLMNVLISILEDAEVSFSLAGSGHVLINSPGRQRSIVCQYSVWSTTETWRCSPRVAKPNRWTWSPNVCETPIRKSERLLRCESSSVRDEYLSLIFSTLSGFLRCSQRAMVDVLRVSGHLSSVRCQG